MTTCGKAKTHVDAEDTDPNFPWGAQMLQSYQETVEWLLEPDHEQPGVRYFALRDLVGVSDDDRELSEAKAAVMASGPVAAILAAQEREGYWVKPGAGYSPKYTGTVWQPIFLAQYGADGSDARVRSACEYVLSHALAKNGVFSANGSPSGSIHCLTGNLIAAFIDLGWLEDERVHAAIEREAQFVTGEGIADASDTKASPRYYRSGTSGPIFVCANNEHLPCAWGAIKALLAFGKIPISMRTESVRRAIDVGVTLLLGNDPAQADYPSVYGDTPSTRWFTFGHPLGYMADVLQNVEALSSVGYIHDPRLRNAITMIESKRDDHGRWRREHSFKGRTWAVVEPVGRPSKWVTLRALRVLHAFSSETHTVSKPTA